MLTPVQTNNLELKLRCDKPTISVREASDRAYRTIVSHQYTAHPLRLSRTFRLDGADSNRAYLYIMNTSPGLLAGDKLGISLQLDTNTSLYLTDQAATKVHPMPIAESNATTNYEIELGKNATLEFVPEPLILYTDAALQQTTNIKLHPTAKLFLSEIILPGRLAKGECYQFRHYFSRLQVTSLSGELWFRDTMRLEGKFNPFKNSDLFASKPVISNLIIVLPQVNLRLFSDRLENLEAAKCPNTIVASSILPHDRGILVRALANNTHQLKKYLQYALNCWRNITNQPPLPYIPK